MLRRLVRYARHGKHEAVEALMASNEFLHAMGHMTEYDRRVTMLTAGKAMRLLWEKAPIPEPEPFTMRLSWDASAIAKLRKIAAQHGVRPGLDRVLAREMGRPLPSVTLARYTYIGRIRAAQPNRRKRPGASAGAKARPRPPLITRYAEGRSKYMDASV